MQKPSPTWLRHLNPFHFERSYLLWALFGNLAITLLLAFCILFLLYYLPRIHHAEDAVQKRSKADTNVLSLHKVIDGKATLLDDTNHCLYTILIGLGGLSVCTTLGNAFYLYKAYKLIPDSSGKPSH